MSYIKYLSDRGGGWTAQVYDDDDNPGETINILDKSSVWSSIENGEDTYRGFPGRPTPQKSSETVTNTSSEETAVNVDRVAFDPRLSKPRDGNYSADPVRAFDPNEEQATREGDLTTDKTKIEDDDDTTSGIPSINNWYAYSTLSGDKGKGKKLFFDLKNERRWYEDAGLILNGSLNEKNYSKEPRTSALIEYGKLDEKGRTPYFYSDFAFCKYWRKIPNNRLITLRRYSVPTFASLEFPDWDPTPPKPDDNNNEKPVAGNNKFMPIAQAVTWMGEETGNAASTLMSFGVGLPWEELKAQVEDYSEQTDPSNLDGGFGSFLRGMGKTLSIVGGETTKQGYLYDGQTPPDPYANGPYANRIMGPVNRIDAVQRRSPGMNFNHDIALKFQYTARSVGAINTKAAMLDIIANFLLLTYGSAPFWGGASRFRGNLQAYPWKKGMAAWYKGDAEGFFDAINESVSKGVQNIGKLFDSIMSDPMKALKDLAGAAMMTAVKKTKPTMFHGMRAILTGEPVGEWHLTVGNPFNPMMMIGNLVCEGCDFEFNDELGPDDFPTELTVTVKLKHGMALDRSGVESMFNKGRGRIYTLPTGVENTSAANETSVDKNTGEQNNPYNNKVQGGAGAAGKPNFKADEKTLEKASASNSKQYNKGTEASIALAKKIELGYADANQSVKNA